MNQLKNSLLIIIVITSCFLLSGCTNPKENLENYYYVMAIGIDSTTEGNINLSVQIASNSNQSSSDKETSQSSTSNIYTVPCYSIDSGLTILNNYLSKKLNLSHCSAIIFSEEIAKKGIKNYINSLGNNLEIRPTCNIIISSTTGLDALETISNSNEQFTSKFYEFIKNSAKYTGYSINPELSEFFYCINMRTSPAIATYATISNKAIQNTGIAIFDDDKFLSDLTVLDSMSYSLIANRLEGATLTIKNPYDLSELIDVEIEQVKKPSISCYLINNYPYIKINLYLEYSLLSSSYSIDTKTISGNKHLKNAINSYIQEMVLSFLYETSHKYNIDLCNFRNIISSNYLTLDEFNKIHWEEIYKDSHFTVNIHGEITDLGIFSNE